MIYKNDCTLPKEYLEQLTTESLTVVFVFASL